MNVQIHQPTSTEAARYRSVLERKIADGAKRAAGVLDAIHTQQPTDAIVRVDRVNFVPDAAGDRLGLGLPAAACDRVLVPSDYALGQLADKASVPAAYARKLAAGEPWQRELAARIFNESYGHATDRVLARMVGGQLRGWLSDRYRRRDSRPLVDALAAEAQELGAVPIDGVATETRVALKVAVPEVFEPIPGEYLVYGGEWSNSDYGNGTHSFRAFALRVACLNGMTRENLLREVHLGGRLSDDVAYSERTYRLDTAASVSALRDVVRAALSAEAFARMGDKIREANARAMSAASLRGTVQALPKATQKAIVDAFEGEDVINLPAGKTAWRASNAVSWVARHTEDDETRLDLERLAGAVATPGSGKHG